MANWTAKKKLGRSQPNCKEFTFNNAREPDQPLIKPQANIMSICKRVLILAKPWGKGYKMGAYKTDLNELSDV